MSVIPFCVVSRRSCLRGVALAAALLGAPAMASAQDSFVRYQDPATGRPVLSVLGTGLGLPFASLTVELACPRPDAWTIAVKGVRAPDGTAVAFGFGDPAGGWAEVRVVPAGYHDRSISLSLDRAAFRVALAQARADYPDARDAEARLVIGEAVGVSVGRDALVREMTDFARACDAPRRPALARRAG
ncbi:hypothetical protein [Roseomonas sp. HF4]|uniref:hypothetical protein n=1 Tax=Roseomonas sp. HF4 TaxID=2562313 RepID=UPI0010C0EF3A|nr:hypothetical protein [Roseomonas sp. HF4]